MKTIVGLYKTVAQANQVKTALTSQGYEADRIRVIDQTSENTGSGYGSGNTTAMGTGEGYSTTGSTTMGSATTGAGSSAAGSSDESIGTKIKDFFGFANSDEEGSHRFDDAAHRSYTEGVAGGGALLAVTVADGDADRTADLLQQHGATDIEGGYQDSNYGSDRNLASNGTADRVSGEQVIPVVAEELAVGKRQVERGGVRIYSHVVSENVSENVRLHDERVVVNRTAVDRPATDADFNPGDRTLEVRAVGEEAVVGKRSRVVEEIHVGKEGSDRTEQVTDTVRHTEVDVEPTVAETTDVTGTNRR